CLAVAGENDLHLRRLVLEHRNGVLLQHSKNRAARLGDPYRARRVAPHEELLERSLAGTVLIEKRAEVARDFEQPRAVRAGSGDESAAGEEVAGAGKKGEAGARH